MPHFNQCSQLVEGMEEAIEQRTRIMENGECVFKEMLNMQKQLQINLAENKPELNPHPDNLDTAGKVLDWLQYQSDCIQDETRELYTSLGGMSKGDKEASSVWKRWKAKNIELRNTKIADLSPEDQLEIKFEMVDIMHFVMCQLIALDIDSEELFLLYYLKNKENFKRWSNGY